MASEDHVCLPQHQEEWIVVVGPGEHGRLYIFLCDSFMHLSAESRLEFSCVCLETRTGSA
jgi:hypothetical protein